MRVTFVPLAISETAAQDETLLDVARRAGVPLGNSCGGTGICLRCRITIVEGAARVGSQTSMERNAIDSGRLDGSPVRLACQTIVRGDCAITTTYWG